MKFRQLIPMIAVCAGLLACTGEPASGPADDASAITPETSQSEKTYELQGKIVQRDPMANTLKVDHDAIGDWMGAMTMTFPVRGADVQDLPADGQSVTATVHVDGTEYWLSDVEAAEAMPEEGSAGTEESSEAEEEGNED